MPSTRPRISFGEDGFCNGCIYNRNRSSDVDWEQRKKELIDLVAKSKNKESNPTYDCVLGWSGG